MVLRFLFALLFITTTMPRAAWAKWGMGTNMSILVETASTNVDLKSTRVNGDAYVLMDVPKLQSWQIELGYVYVDAVDPLSATTEANYTIASPSVGARWNLDKNGVFALSGLLLPSAGLTLSKTGNGSEDWSGVGFLGKVLVQPPLSAHWKLVVSLHYLDVRFDQRLSTNTLPSGGASTVSHTFMYPNLGFLFSF